jgi:hypothetical protein
MVVLIPVPVVIIPPGVLVKVHVPDSGKLFKITLPVANVQVGCVIETTSGTGYGLTVICKGVALLGPQTELPVTCKSPEAAEGGKLTVILFVVPPLV